METSYSLENENLIRNNLVDVGVSLNWFWFKSTQQTLTGQRAFLKLSDKFNQLIKYPMVHWDTWCNH